MEEEDRRGVWSFVEPIQIPQKITDKGGADVDIGVEKTPRR